MERDIGAVPVALLRQHGLRRQRAVVEKAFELGEFAIDEAPQGGRDLDVAPGQFDPHQ